jgi:hypothetical protein
MSVHCCEMMRLKIENVCDQHPDRRACPDTVIDYSPSSDSYGLPIHDGEDGFAASWIKISYCPWCATKLPNGLEAAA